MVMCGLKEGVKTVRFLTIRHDASSVAQSYDNLAIYL